MAPKSQEYQRLIKLIKCFLVYCVDIKPVNSRNMERKALMLFIVQNRERIKQIAKDNNMKVYGWTMGLSFAELMLCARAICTNYNLPMPVNENEIAYHFSVENHDNCGRVPISFAYDADENTINVVGGTKKPRGRNSHV